MAFFTVTAGSPLATLLKSIIGQDIAGGTLRTQDSGVIIVEKGASVYQLVDGTWKHTLNGTRTEAGQVTPQSMAALRSHATTAGRKKT